MENDDSGGSGGENPTFPNSIEVLSSGTFVFGLHTLHSFLFLSEVSLFLFLFNQCQVFQGNVSRTKVEGLEEKKNSPGNTQKNNYFHPEIGQDTCDDR